MFADRRVGLLDLFHLGKLAAVSSSTTVTNRESGIMRGPVQNVWGLSSEVITVFYIKYNSIFHENGIKWVLKILSQNFDSMGAHH